MRRVAVFLLAIGLVGCTAQRTSGRPIAEFLAFGDGGYHYAYLEPDDGEGVTTREEFIEKERLDWLDDKRPPAEFKPPPAHRRSDTGNYVAASGQVAVATAMRRWCEGPPACEFAVMLGDNIYPNGATAEVDGRDDAERFRQVLFEPYAPLAAFSEEFRIYVALGNHDWRTSREGAMAEVRYLEETRPFYMDGIRYRIAPTGNPREVEIFVLDTHVLLSGVTVLEDELADDASELHTEDVDPPNDWSQPQNEVERGMVDWLERSLADSPARWKIVMGHHPIWSSAGSKFQQARALRALILSALCRHADLYLAGHEHTLELHADACKDVPEAGGRPPLVEVVSGAAGKQRPLNTAFQRHQLAANPELTSVWTRGLAWGFAHVTLDPDQATIRLLTTPDEGNGEPVLAFEHRFDRRSGRP